VTAFALWQVQAPPVPPPAPLPPLPPLSPVITIPDIQVPEVIVTAPGVPPWATLPPPLLLLSFLALCAAAAIVLYPLMRAIARRIEGRVRDPELEREVHELRERVRDLEHGGTRLSELEERLDFAERLLAQRRDSAQLPNG
jgi:hypothetical protein